MPNVLLADAPLRCQQQACPILPGMLLRRGFDGANGGKPAGANLASLRPASVPVLRWFRAHRGNRERERRAIVEAAILRDVHVLWIVRAVYGFAGRCAYRMEFEDAMTRTVTIEIPLPPKFCQSNGPHFHWAVKAKARKQYREEAFYCARQVHHAPFCGPVRLSVVVYAARKAHDGRYRPCDAQNLTAALKGAIDGIVDSGLIADDNHRVLSWGEMAFRTTAEEHGGRSCVILTFEEVTA